MKLSADLWMLKTNASPKDSGGDDDEENKEDIRWQWWKMR